MRKNYSPVFIAFFVCLAKTATLAQPPAWSVNPANYAHSMNLIAQIYLDSGEVNSGANLLGAFVGTEVRGVATPTLIIGDAYYFMTIYSNVASGETVTFKVWLDSTNTIYSALEQLPFVKNAQVGGYPNGYDINITPGDDWPISLLPIPYDTALATFPFDAIDLDDFLVSLDNDSVAFTFAAGSNLTTVFSDSNNVLQVIPTSSTWTGTDSVLVTATEIGTANGFSASRQVLFTVESGYAPPVFDDFPLQFIQGFLPPPTGDLDDMLTYGGSCLDYAALLIPPTGTTPNPNWTHPGGNATNMDLVMQVKFDGNPVPGSQNRLAGFVGGQLAGVASPQIVSGTELYFLTLANVGAGEITVKFYDEARQYLHEQATGIEFVPAGSAGSWSSPIVLEFAPIQVAVSPLGVWTTSILDPTWSGGLRTWFIATDCEWAFLSDTAEVFFLVGRCPEQVVELPSGGGSLCLEAEGDAYFVSWMLNGEQAGTGQTFNVNEEGLYYYEGWDADSCHVVRSCPVFVVAGNSSDLQVPTGNSEKSANFSNSVASLAFPPTVCGAIVVDTITLNTGLTNWYKDADADDYSTGETMQSCLSPGATWYLASQLIATSGDCNDANPAIHPGAAELCNGIDDDCSGSPESLATIWTGTGDGINWSNSANWSDGIVPLTCQDVVIPAGFNVTVAAGFHAVGRTLQVALGAILMVPLTAIMEIDN